MAAGSPEMQVSMAALVLTSCGQEVSADNLSKVIKAAGGEVPAYWPKLFAESAAGIDIKDLMTSAGSVGGGAAVPAAGGAAAPAEEKKEEEKKEEKEESEDEDMGFSLFD